MAAGRNFSFLSGPFLSHTRAGRMETEGGFVSGGFFRGWCVVEVATSTIGVWQAEPSVAQTGGNRQMWR